MKGGSTVKTSRLWGLVVNLEKLDLGSGTVWENSGTNPDFGSGGSFYCEF